MSVEAAKWAWALGTLGFATRRVAGELPDGARYADTLLGWLHRDGVEAPRPTELADALAGADLAVVENLCSLPLNRAAARAAATVLDRWPGRVVFRHHDLPWQRAELAHVTDLPPRRPGSLHVTVNDRSRLELAARGIVAHTVRNAFDVDAPPGDRHATRGALGFARDDVVVLQPTRAIPRKDVPAGVRFAEALARHVPGRRVRYWLTGPAEDGYQPELDRVLAGAAVAVTQGRVGRAADAYAAADLVVLPSTWEGFGNAVPESAIARRPIAAAGYPVLDELARLGFTLFSVDAPRDLAEWLRRPDPTLLDANAAVARRHVALGDLPGRITACFEAMGWSSW